MAPQFNDAMLPPGVEPGDTLYVADRALDVVHSNEGWASFARQNRGDDLLAEHRRLNLLDGMSEKHRARWARIYDLLLSGRLDHHQEKMICSSPSEARLYQLRITPTRDESGQVTHLVHHAVRIDEDPGSSGGVFHASNMSEKQRRLARDYQELIVDRHVQVPRFAVAKHFAPLDGVGGDLIWHREHEDGPCDLIHADVMGHGEEAAGFATRIVDLLEELSREALEPAETVAALNEALLGIIPEGDVLFATGLAFRFDPRAPTLSCCSFGHTGPIFSRAGHVSLEIGLPVGLGPAEIPWRTAALDLTEHGERFLAFSDGITEQFDPRGEMFGVEGLRKAFLEHLHLPVKDMLDRIVEQLRTFRGPAVVKDDQTLLALEFLGDAGRGPNDPLSSRRPGSPRSPAAGRPR